MYHLVPSQLTSLFASPLCIVHVHCMHGTTLQIWQTPDVKVASWLVCSCLDGAVLVRGPPGHEHCAVFLGKTLYFHSASLHPGV